jgi:hypothetical protein
MEKTHPHSHSLLHLSCQRGHQPDNRTHPLVGQNKLQELHNFCKRHFADKLERARKKMNDQQLKLKGMQAAKVKDQKSIETSMFKVLKEIGVELSAFHGGSLNGKDIKQVMNNASHVFDQFAAIFKEGKRPDCLLLDDDIDAMCLHFRKVFVLWDGAFLLARIRNLTE